MEWVLQKGLCFCSVDGKGDMIVTVLAILRLSHLMYARFVADQLNSAVNNTSDWPNLKIHVTFQKYYWYWYAG